MMLLIPTCCTAYLYQMKKTPALALLITGLMLVTVAPLIGQHFHLADSTRGFITGTGIGIEIMAILIIRRRKIKRMAR